MKNYKDLTKDIKNGTLSPVYLFTGSEDHIASMMIQRMSEKLVTPGLEMLNINRFESKKPDISEIMAACETLPVMSERRIVLASEETALLSVSDKNAQEALSGYFKNPCPSTILIISAEKPDKRRKLYKEAVRAGELVEFSKLDQRGLENWIAARMKRAGVRIGRPAVEAFIGRIHYLDNASVSTISVDSELQKLIDFAGEGGQITEEDVLEILPPGMEDNIFRMTDLIAQGKAQEAMDMLRKFQLEGESPIRIFGLIVRQVRIMAMLSAMIAEKANQQQMADYAGIPPFVVRKTLPAVRRYAPGRLEELIVEAADTDLWMKTGAIEQSLAVELYVLKMLKRK